MLLNQVEFDLQIGDGGRFHPAFDLGTVLVTIDDQNKVTVYRAGYGYGTFDPGNSHITFQFSIWDPRTNLYSLDGYVMEANQGTPILFVGTYIFAMANPESPTPSEPRDEILWPSKGFSAATEGIAGGSGFQAETVCATMRRPKSLVEVLQQRSRVRASHDSVQAGP
jgi:hypothetical protein